VAVSFKLTPRENQIAELIKQGLSNDAISDRLCIANSTVVTHVQSIYSKLGLEDLPQGQKRAWIRNEYKSDNI